MDEFLQVSVNNTGSGRIGMLTSRVHALVWPNYALIETDKQELVHLMRPSIKKISIVDNHL